MTKLEFQRLLTPLVDIMNNIELDMIHNILNRIENYNDVKGTLKWLTDKLNETKLLDKDNFKILKSNKKELKKVIKDLAENCGTYIENFDNLEKYYNNGLLDINPVELYDSVSINNLINEAIKDTDDIMNLIQTKAIEGANEEYKNILNKAYIETASGVYTYQESIKNALDEFAKKGISAAHYKNGKTLSIESVTRRDVITRMNKLVGDVELQHAKELNTNLVYVDQHLGARVRTPYTKEDYEVHAEWQGKKYMIEGSNDKYDNLYEKTGYGEMLGLKGINCYHNMRPTWEWEEILPQIDLEKNKQQYEKLQQMRAYERKLRNLKRERIINKIEENKTEYTKSNKKLSEVSKKYNNWLKENDLTRNYNREYVSDRK